MNPLLPLFALFALFAVAASARKAKAATTAVTPRALPEPQPSFVPPEPPAPWPERVPIEAPVSAPAVQQEPAPTPVRATLPEQVSLQPAPVTPEPSTPTPEHAAPAPAVAPEAQTPAPTPLHSAASAPQATPSPAYPAVPLDQPPHNLAELAQQAHIIFTTPAPASTPPGAPHAAAQASSSIDQSTLTPPPAAEAVTPTGPTPTSAPPSRSGYDPEKARRITPRIAAHLNKKGVAGYSRQSLREFQRLAGLKDDGIYGGGTAGAIRYYLKGATPPKPMFAPLQEVPYVPPKGGSHD